MQDSVDAAASHSIVQSRPDYGSGSSSGSGSGSGLDRDPEGGPGRRNRAGFDEPILRLLLNGAPDKAIAARLRVSERTVQRHVRTLLAKVGAHNRMQLGQILARRARYAAEPHTEADGLDAGPRAAPPPPQQQQQQHKITDFDAQVLARLLHGLPESAIAEGLCVSRRTVQRSVKGLMTRAGAANRVQLGWYAQRNGWI